jgi:NTE family protein
MGANEIIFGLVLGGGGARGAAHIGVFMELEQLGLTPDFVVGTSIGGIVGALIAAGLDSEQLVDVFQQLQFGKMYALPWRKPAMMDTHKLEKLLRKTIGVRQFEELDISLALVTTDLIDRVEVVIDKGDIVSAVLATTAFPVVFPPVRRDGKTLIDGGVLNNTPFNVALERGTKYTVAVDLSNSAPYGSPVPYPPRNNILTRLLTRTQRDPMYQSVSTLADIITARNVKDHMKHAQPTVFLEPDMGSIGLFDFHRLQEGIAAGRQVVNENMGALQALAKQVKDEKK